MIPSDIKIRPISKEDTGLIIKWRNDPRVRDNFIFQEPFTADLHNEWLKEKVKKGLAIQYIICIGKDEQPVGSVYFSHVEKDSAEYGIFIGEEDAKGKGIGTGAGRLLIKKGFEEFGFDEIYLRVFTDNIPAIKSYEKIGFKIKDTLKAVECTTGEKRDMYLMETRKV
ncbi:MAG: GNAT family N-acetyltransferase [Lachnospiraceae bacterium]|nr:GNAT family N-acetyltransferase [Lachnospiraceae bacterium]